MNLKCIKYLTIILILILSCKLEPPNEEPPPGDTAPPHIMVVYPANDAIEVSVTNSVSVTFSEPMDKTIAQGAFSLSDGVTPVAGTFSWSDDTMTFDPSSNLSCSVKYYVKVTTSAKDTSGNPLASEFNSSFTTAAGPDTTPPSITAVSPVDLATSVAVTTSVSITFSEQMDVASVQNAFTLSAGVTVVSGTFGWSANTMSFVPISNLSFNTTYSVKVTTSAKDTSGNPLAGEFNSTFTTATEPNVYVSPTGSDSNAGTPDSPLLTLSAGVALAQTRKPAEVRVEGNPAGVLYNLGSIGLLIPSGVSLMGGYNSAFSSRNANTYISKITSTDDYTILFDGVSITEDTVIDGFTINNTKSYSEGVFTVYCRNSASPTISNNFIQNSASFISTSVSNSCATACIYLVGSHALIENNIVNGGSGSAFMEYSAGSCGIYCRESSPLIISNTAVRGGNGTGTTDAIGGFGSAAIYCYNSSPTISDNDLIQGGSGTSAAESGSGSVGIALSYSTGNIEHNSEIDGGSGNSTATISVRRGPGSVAVSGYSSTLLIQNNSSIYGGSGVGGGSVGINGDGLSGAIRYNGRIGGGSGTWSPDGCFGSAALYFIGGNCEISENTQIVGGSGTGADNGSVGIVSMGGNESLVIKGNSCIEGGSGLATDYWDPGGGSVGIYCWGGVVKIIGNCIFGGTGRTSVSSHAGSVGIFCCYQSSDTVVANNLIKGQDGDAKTDAFVDSAGIYFSKSSLGTVVNNTISASTTREVAVALYLDSPNQRFANNIVYTENGTLRYGTYENGTSSDPFIFAGNLIFNCPSALYYDEGTEAIASISEVNALAECSDNLTTTQVLSQLFIGGLPFDYHLTSGADAIDAGINTSTSYWGSVIDDIDGETRPKGSAYDIGFDEY